jgi:hypothetical protein
VRFTILLRACRKRSARTELAGTRVKLQRRRGGRNFKTIATKNVGLRCAVRLRLKTRRGAVDYRAIWPKQNRTFRRGHSPVVTVTRAF